MKPEEPVSVYFKQKNDSFITSIMFHGKIVSFKKFRYGFISHPLRPKNIFFYFKKSPRPVTNRLKAGTAVSFAIVESEASNFSEQAVALRLL